MSWLFALKARAWAIGGFLLAVVAVLARLQLLEHQRDKARARVKVAKAEANMARNNERIAATTRSERRATREQAVQEIMAGKVPDSLGSGINDGWR